MTSTTLIWIVAVSLAIGFNFWLMHWLRRRLWKPGEVQGIRMLGTYSPLLTWLAGAPPVEAAPPYRATLLVAVAGAAALAVLGQTIYSRGPESRLAGASLIAGGVVLLGLAQRVVMKRALPAWLTSLSARLRLLPHQPLLWPLAGAGAYAAYFFAGDGPLMRHPWAAALSWVGALALMLAGTANAGAREAAAPTPEARGRPWDRAEVYFVATLFVFAFVLRAVDLGGIPASLTGDEGSAGLAAVDILAGRFNNLFAVSWYSFPALYFFVPALSIGAFGPSYAALRLPSALAGALTVVGLYGMARPMFGRTVAALSACVLAALNFHLHFSRIGLNNIWDGLLAVLTLGLFWRGWQTGRRALFVGAGLLLGLSQYFYTSARLLLVLLAAWLVLSMVFQWPRFRERLPEVLALGLAALVVIMPLGLFYLARPEEFYAPMRRFSLLSGNWLDFTMRATGHPAWLLLLLSLRDAALGFTSTPLRYWYTSGQPMLLPVPAGLFFLGLALALFNLKESRYWLLLLWLTGVVAVGALTDSAPASQRYVIAAPAVALLVAVPLQTMARWVTEVWPRARRATLVLAAAVVAVVAVQDVRFYFVEYVPGAGRGDLNTQVASALGRLLREYPPGSQAYFFGPPRMGYYGFSTIPFMAPQVQGHDVVEGLTAPPDWQLTGPRTAFIFLPERQAELGYVQQRYPGGAARWFAASDGVLLFLLYQVDAL